MCDSVQEQYKGRPSKWLLHLWGGLCLNSFGEASGLSKLIIQIFFLEDSASATTSTLLAGTLTALLITLGYLSSTQLLSVIENSKFDTRHKKSVIFSLPFVYFMAIFPLSMSLSLCIDL